MTSPTEMMGVSGEQLLIPDTSIIRGILEDAGIESVESLETIPVDFDIIANTSSKCTFSAHSAAPVCEAFPKDVLVRIENSQCSVASVAGLQNLAHAHAPDVVPEVLALGITTADDGRPFEYSVREFSTDTIPLEDVWETLDQDHKAELVNKIVKSIEQLQKINSSIVNVVASLPSKFYGVGNSPNQENSAKIICGGPRLGYYPDMQSFMRGFIRDQTMDPCPCEVLDNGGGSITIKSRFKDIGQVKFTRQDLKDLQRSVVLCHNDLTPANILVRPAASSKANGTKPRYEVASIIGWEDAAFTPYALDWAVQDCRLGYENISFNWYSMLRERTQHLLPKGDAHTKLLKAVRIIEASAWRMSPRHFRPLVRDKWMAIHGVQRSSDPRVGHSRKAGAGPLPADFGHDNMDELHLDAFQQLGMLNEAILEEMARRRGA